MSPFRSNATLACFLVLMTGLASARASDVKKGKELFEKCAACHSLEANKNDDAPSLAGVFGRKAAAVEDYRYSAAMKQSNVVWDESTLDSFIEDPQAFIPGNRMPFDGLKDKTDREDLLAYLKQATKNSDSAQLHFWLVPQRENLKGTPVSSMVTRNVSYCGKKRSLANTSVPRKSVAVCMCVSSNQPGTPTSTSSSTSALN
jgi:cytochrome c2